MIEVIIADMNLMATHHLIAEKTDEHGRTFHQGEKHVSQSDQATLLGTRIWKESTIQWTPI